MKNLGSSIGGLAFVGVVALMIVPLPAAPKDPAVMVAGLKAISSKKVSSEF